MPKINGSKFRRLLVLGSLTAVSGIASASGDPTTAVAIAKTIALADANTAQLIATAALVGLFVTAAGAAIVINRIKKAKTA